MSRAGVSEKIRQDKIDDWVSHATRLATHTIAHLQRTRCVRWFHAGVGNFVSGGNHSDSAMSKRRAFKFTQIIVPLLPLPLGCWFLYKALKSFNRNPPPIATDSATVLARPLYAEPVYQVRACVY